jgi:hypothetical protein
MKTNFLQEITHPTPRSVLFSLPPIGLGTVLSEGLPSYLSRLAKAHSLLLCVLLAKYILPMLENHSLTKSLDRGSGRLYERPGNFLGLNDFTLKLVTILEDLTVRNDLVFLTLLPFRHIIDQHGLLKEFRSWCPACLESWRKNQKEIYEPLIWSLQMILVCPIHRCYLLTTCPTCKRTQHVIARKMQAGYCSSCGSWLVYDEFPRSSPPVGAYDLWIMQNMAQLLESAQTLPFVPFKDLVVECLSRYIKDHFCNSASSFAISFQIPKATAKRWNAVSSFPTLQHLFQLSYLSNTPLTDLIFKGVLKKRIKTRAMPAAYIRSSKETSQRKTIDHESVLRFLRNTLESQAEHRTMEQVSKQLGYTKKTLYSHYPELCKAIAAKATNHRISARDASIKQLTLFVETTTRQLHFSGIYPSYDRVEAASKKGILRGKEGRKTWRTTMKQLRLWR